MPEEKVPVTIKSMDAATWEEARKAAQFQGETMAEWLGRAIRQLAELERAARENPPTNQDNRPGGFSSPAIPRSELESLMRGVAALAAAAGVPPPKRLATHAYALVTAQLREARGLPASKPPKSRRQTVRPVLVHNSDATSEAGSS